MLQPSGHFCASKTLHMCCALFRRELDWPHQSFKSWMKPSVAATAESGAGRHDRRLVVGATGRAGEGVGFRRAPHGVAGHVAPGVQGVVVVLVVAAGGVGRPAALALVPAAGLDPIVSADRRVDDELVLGRAAGRVEQRIPAIVDGVVRVLSSKHRCRSRSRSRPRPPPWTEEGAALCKARGARTMMQRAAGTEGQLTRSGQ